MAQLDSLRLQLTQQVTQTARTTADEWERTLKRTGPSDSGNMNANTSVKVSARSGSFDIVATIDTPYAHIVAGGQRAHRIVPARTGGVLAFDDGGRVVFARSVNHPGAQPNSWWDNAFRQVPDMLQRNWRAATS